MSAKGNCTKVNGKIVYKTVSKTGSPPASLDSSKWYMDKCEIVGYRSEHLTLTVNEDGIIRVDGNFNDGKASRSFFKEYIIPDGVDYEALEFRIYEGDANKLVIVGAIGSDGGELVSDHTESTSIVKRTESVQISSTFTETIESIELEGSEDMSKDVRVVDNKFEAKVNVSEYKNEEVHIKISKKVVLIYTSRKEVTKTSTRQEIKKTFEIPAGVKPESIKSVVGQDGNLTVSAPVDNELAKQQRIEETTKKSVTTTNSTNEVSIRIRTVNTTKSVTREDLKDVKIVNDRFEMNVDLREYELNEVTVKIIKNRRVITISANHQSQFESRSAHREFTLPEGAPDSNPSAIDAVLSPNGILTITGPCTPQTVPAALTNVTDDVTNRVLQQQNQNTTVQQQQQQNTSVKQQNTSVQQQNNTVQQQQQKNTSVQRQDTSVQSEQQVVQQSRYTKITKHETFVSSTMTSLDVTEAGDNDEPVISQPDTPIEDVTVDMVIDEDGNYITEVDIKDYRPEEITIKASKAVITIVGRKTEENREFVKTIRVPIDVVVTPDKIRSIFDRATRVLTIIITRNKSVTTTTTKQVTDNTTQDQINEQKRIDSLQQQQQRQQVQQKQESVHETQTKVQTQQQVNQQKQVQQKQESIEETQTKVQTQQQVNQQKQVQRKQQSVEETQTEVQTQQQINQQRQVQQNQQDQTTQQVRQQDQRQQNTTNTTTTTSKRTIKTTKTTVETLQKLGYNFDSATSQEYTGDPKFFERATKVVDYKPEDLEVKIAMPWVIVEGKQEMTAENGWRSKQFTKMFTVPQGVKEENIQLEWNEAGDVVNCTALIG